MEQLRTANDMLRALQGDIHAVKTGKMTESVGRVVLRGRSLQLRTAELNLKYQRLLQGANGKAIPLLATGGTNKAKHKA